MKEEIKQLRLRGIKVCRIHSFKDAELRKLRLLRIRELSRLRKVLTDSNEGLGGANPYVNVCSQLRMENDLYYGELDRGEDLNYDMKKNIARNIVFISHIAMKLHFVTESVSKLEEQNVMLNMQFMNKRETLFKIKDLKRALEEEIKDKQEQFELLTNTKLLKDFKMTDDLLSQELENNSRLLKVLGHWWEGFDEKKNIKM